MMKRISKNNMIVIIKKNRISRKCCDSYSCSDISGVVYSPLGGIARIRDAVV